MSSYGQFLFSTPGLRSFVFFVGVVFSEHPTGFSQFLFERWQGERFIELARLILIFCLAFVAIIGLARFFCFAVAVFYLSSGRGEILLGSWGYFFCFASGSRSFLLELGFCGLFWRGGDREIVSLSSRG